MEVLHPHCAGLDVHKDSVVACVRHMVNGDVKREVRSFKTTTQGLMTLSEWLSVEGSTHIVMEAAGVYWKPVWHILADGEFALVLANAAHVKNVPGHKTDVSDATWLAELLAQGWSAGVLFPTSRAGDAQSVAHPQAARARAQQPHPAAAEDATSSSTWSSPTSWACPVVG
jgi:transposase